MSSFSQAAEEIYSFYLGDSPIGWAKRIQLAEFFSDVTFNFECLHAAHLHAKFAAEQQSPFFYLFGYEGSWSFPHLYDPEKRDFGGVSHLDDIRYFMK